MLGTFHFSFKKISVRFNVGHYGIKFFCTLKMNKIKLPNDFKSSADIALEAEKEEHTVQ